MQSSLAAKIKDGAFHLHSMLNMDHNGGHTLAYS